VTSYDETPRDAERVTDGDVEASPSTPDSDLPTRHGTDVEGGVEGGDVSLDRDERQGIGDLD
jgi:hypothetical protein